MGMRVEDAKLAHQMVVEKIKTERKRLFRFQPSGSFGKPLLERELPRMAQRNQNKGFRHVLRRGDQALMEICCEAALHFAPVGSEFLAHEIILHTGEVDVGQTTG